LKFYKEWKTATTFLHISHFIRERIPLPLFSLLRKERKYGRKARLGRWKCFSERRKDDSERCFGVLCFFQVLPGRRGGRGRLGRTSRYSSLQSPIVAVVDIHSSRHTIVIRHRQRMRHMRALVVASTTNTTMMMLMVVVVLLLLL